MALTDTSEHDMKTTFLTSLEGAHSTLDGVLGRLSNLTDRLVGAVPEPVQNSGGKLESVPTGVFERIQRHGTDMDAKLDRAHKLLDRIERALP